MGYQFHNLSLDERVRTENRLYDEAHTSVPDKTGARYQISKMNSTVFEGEPYIFRAIIDPKPK